MKDYVLKFYLAFSYNKPIYTHFQVLHKHQVHMKTTQYVMFINSTAQNFHQSKNVYTKFSPCSITAKLINMFLSSMYIYTKHMQR